ncbi:hypothetical protein BpHYR1_029762 [Brachionus plicatilis]|uniref:Uncharacterized protein n=1 Tax=Brachionus plicatilis TaxID=10195 RepID=A0A3M7PG49_BRAPC|nr:hypothetical protein BpHYR1_029762 [Brachionus plicatilis]
MNAEITLHTYLIVIINYLEISNGQILLIKNFVNFISKVNMDLLLTIQYPTPNILKASKKTNLIISATLLEKYFLKLDQNSFNEKIDMFLLDLRKKLALD